MRIFSRERKKFRANKHAKACTGGTQGGVGKAVVLGIIECEGELRAMDVENGRGNTLKGAVRNNVQPGATLMTDDDVAFRGLNASYTHLSGNQSKGEYARLGDFIHTNSTKGMWSLLNRQIVGIHHWVSPKHLNMYVGKMGWRFNRRECPHR